MNDNVVIKWQCEDCNTINQCTIGESHKKTQWCVTCNKPHYVDVKITVGKMTIFKYNKNE